MINSFTMRKKVFWFWGFFDFLYVAWYAANSYKLGNIPYFSDIISMVETIGEHGSLSLAIVMILSLLFQLSIIASAVMLGLCSRSAKILSYAQVPFRLYFIIPSISLILIGVSFLDYYSVALVIGLVVISELLKVISLWKVN